MEAKKTLAGTDFGELVRERRCQFGLPLSIAEKVLPFRPTSSPEAVIDVHTCIVDDTLSGDASPSDPAPADPPSWRMTHAEGRVADAWAQLQAAEQSRRSRQVLDRLEKAYRAELTTLIHLAQDDAS
jgi:hypothetical protein